MDKIYAVIANLYNESHIEKVFATKELAEKYANFNRKGLYSYSVMPCEVLKECNLDDCVVLSGVYKFDNYKISKVDLNGYVMPTMDAYKSLTFNIRNDDEYVLFVSNIYNDNVDSFNTNKEKYLADRETSMDKIAYDTINIIRYYLSQNFSVYDINRVLSDGE